MNHTGLIVEVSLHTAVAVEARATVLRHSFWGAYGPPSRDKVAVYRAKNLTPVEVADIVAAAESYVGRKYGYLSIAAHVADWCLLGVYAFRRLVLGGKYPTCSWVVASAFAKADKNFGVAPGAAEPDDIWDFVNKRPDIYEQILPLKPLADAAAAPVMAPAAVQ